MSGEPRVASKLTQRLCSFEAWVQASRLSPSLGRASLALIFCLVPVVVGCRSEAGGQRRELRAAAVGRDLVLLTIDTLRADRLGAYGYSERDNSPRIDALLASGARFERAMAPRALTWPSLASVLTGLYPSGHGVIQNGYQLPDQLETLPKILRRAGYETGAFLSSMCKANHQGWDAFACSGGADARTVRRALDWVRQRNPGRPFFLWVHLFGAHQPYYTGGDRAIRELDPDYEGPLGTKSRQLKRIVKDQLELSPRDLRHLDAIYDAAVMGTDSRVGSLLDGLETEGALENVVLVFLSDHGEELYQHNDYMFHACSVYQTTLHVPLGFVAPDLIPPGRVLSQTVELTDVAPTLAELLGISGLPPTHGGSLVPYLEASDDGLGRPAFSEYGDTRIRTVLTGDWKLIHNPDALTPVCLADAPADFYSIGVEELYYLGDDPGETENVAADHPDRVRDLKQLISERFADMTTRDLRQEVPEGLRRRLQALGYVTSEEDSPPTQ